MFERRFAAGGRPWILCLSFLAIFISATWFGVPAEAHYRHHFYYHHWRVVFHQRHWRAAFHHHRSYERREARSYEPRETSSRLAEIVVDNNSGRVLYAVNENDLRHPASITKVMTLYLLFEQLEKGRLHLNSRISISAHAAAQAPTKLGLRPGATIDVDDAIKAVVTLSANDIAVAIAEAIGGDEDTFAAMMTRKAHALGMMHTHYANASGLPNDEQITTAADLVTLGRAVQERFPRYYHYFSTEVFRYRGIANHNHNHLLGRIAGMDGIKTGYTRASGFNLLTSVKRNGHAIVAVVLGGSTAASRDRIMAGLIESEIDRSSTRRSGSVLADTAVPSEAADPEMEDQAGSGDTDDDNTDDGAQQPDSAPAKPYPRLPEDADTMRVSSIATPMPVPRPRPAFVSGAPASNPSSLGPTASFVTQTTFDGATERASASTTTPSSLRWVVGPKPAPTHAEQVARGEGDNADDQRPSGVTREPRSSTTPSQSSDNATTEDETADDAPAASEAPAQDTPAAPEPAPPAAAHTGWMIQIGATDDIAKANDLLSRAKARGLKLLGDAEAFTEKVQKGSTTLYRARFAGLDADDAQAVCRSLKRSGFACFATKN